MDWNAIFWIGLKVFAVLALVALNGLFVAAEFALVKIRDTQLRPLIIKGNRQARLAMHVLENLDSALSAAQLGITLASLALGWVGEPVFKDLLQPVFTLFQVTSPEWQHTISTIVGFTAITFLHITAGEQAPKWLAIQNPLPTSLWLAGPLLAFRKMSYPFIWVLNHASLLMLKRIGIEPASEHEMAHSEEELRLMFAAARKDSTGTPLGRQIVLNALDLQRRIVRQVMRPRQEMVVLSTEATVTECLDVAEKTRYSRFPLCEEGDPDKTVGVIHFKDLFAMRLKARAGADLVPAARKLIYVPETARLEKVLQLFLERKLHMAIVVDEYGGTIGMVTLENILEELVGQIQDEFDQEKPLLEKKGEQIWHIEGALPLHELSELIGEPLQEEGVTTTSGWVSHKLGGFPKPGDLLQVGDYQIRVDDLDGLKVSRLTLEKLAPSPEIRPSDEEQ